MIPGNTGEHHCPCVVHVNDTSLDGGQTLIKPWVWQLSIQSLLVRLDEGRTASAVLEQKTAKYILRSNVSSEKWSVQKGYPSRSGGGCRNEERSANGQENPWHSEGDSYQLVAPSPRHQSATGERTGRQGSGDPVISLQTIACNHSASSILYTDLHFGLKR